MKKIKQEKAITLIALIITIVVLIVLAVVAVASIRNNNVIGYADKAATKQKEKQAEEQSKLNEDAALLDQYLKNDDTESDGGSVDPNICSHPNIDVKYTSYNNVNTHYCELVCNDCGMTDNGYLPHDYSGGKICSLCGQENKCTESESHSYYRYVYSTQGDDIYGHWGYLKCSNCGFVVQDSDFFEEHSFDSNGDCACGWHTDNPYWS